MKRKIGFAVVCLLIIFIFFLISFNWLKSPNKTDSTAKNNLIKVGYDIANVNNGPFIIALLSDYFKAHNVVIQATPMEGNELRLAISLKQIDISLTTVNDIFIPISKGIPIKILMPLASAPTYLYVRPADNLTTFEDLIGKTIAATPGSPMECNVKYVLKKEQINYSKINFIRVDKVYRPVALVEKKLVDAVPIGADEVAKFTEAGAIIHQEWKRNGYADRNIPETIIAINEDFRKADQLLVERFIEAIIDGHRFIKSNPDMAAQLVSTFLEKESEGTVAMSVGSLVDIWQNNKLEYNLWYDPSIFTEMWQIALEIDQIEVSLPLNQIYDSSYEEKLKNAQNEIYPLN